MNSNMQKIYSEVSGSIWKVEVVAGQTVAAGDVLMIVESMKMEIPVDAPATARVAEIFVAEGDTVSEGQLLARLQA